MAESVTLKRSDVKKSLVSLGLVFFIPFFLIGLWVFVMFVALGAAALKSNVGQHRTWARIVCTHNQRMNWKLMEAFLKMDSYQK